MRRFRPRISILNALLLTAIVAMVIVISQFWREIRPLRAEVRQLRNETGRLSIEDPAQLYAIEVRTQEDRTWKWRVWVPQGETVNIHLQWGHVPKTGVPSVSNSLTLEPGENWITLSAIYDPNAKLWLSKLADERSSIGSVIQPGEHWFDMKQCSAISDGVTFSTSEAKPDQSSMVLKRYRADEVGSSLNVTSQPTAGFIIWLDR